ncbi:MAG: metallophosphoesterase family protein [Patescibacteria group bacterium]
MSLAVISDTHLTDRFYPNKFNKLKSIIENADTVVLNGDFWDGYRVDFDKFYKSKWNGLFPLLKSKKAIYIYGNHDKESFSDERRNEFCSIAAKRYTLNYAGKDITFEHGDEYVWKVDRMLGLERPNRIVNLITEFFQAEMIKIFGVVAFGWLFGKMNNQIKSALRKMSEVNENAVYFFGHVHVAEVDMDNKFVNSGIFNYGYAQYVLVDKSGTIKPMNERY